MRLSYRCIACLCVILGAAAPGAAQERRVALVIGNGAYQHTAPLPNPANDARDIAAGLAEAKFEVVLGLDLDKRGLEDKLREFVRAVGTADVALFFYAGHGLQVSGQNYLVPIDAKLETERDVQFETMRVDLVLSQMEIDRDGKMNLIFLDACRDNPLARNLARSMGTRSTTLGKGLAQVQTGIGTFMSFSTQPGNVALDGEGPNSPFAGSLAKHMLTPGQNIHGVMSNVRRDVLRATQGKQVPWDHASLIGDFYFVPPNAPAAAPAAAPDAKSNSEMAAMRERLDMLEKQLAADRSKATAQGAPGASPPQDVAALEVPRPEPTPAIPRQRPAEPLAPADPAAWIMPSGDYANQRHSTLDQINTRNAATLRLAWEFSTGVLRGHEGNPLVAGGIMYVHTPFPNIVYALDLAKDGQVIWKYEPRQDPSVIPIMCCDTVNRGPVLDGQGRLFLHQADTSLVALDARTGRELWKAINGDPKKGESGTSAPLVVKDKVIVGMSGGEFGLRGHLTAYDTRTGKRLWRAYSVGPDKDILVDPARTTSLGKPVGRDSSLKTWTGDQWKIGGGTTWGWLSYDADLDLLYYGTGNPSTWNAAQRPGPDGRPIDQKWTESIFARDPNTGVARWIYQMTPFDEWNYDGVNEMILADVDVAGGKRKALVHFDKNGFGYTLDRATGEPLVAGKFDPTVNWATHVVMDRRDPQYGRPQVDPRYSTFLNGQDVNSKNICPSSAGAKNQGPAAYSPLTGLFYVPVNHQCMDYEPFKVSYTAGQPYVGATLSIFPPDGDTHMGAFTAWDAGSGKIVWSNKEQFSLWSGVLTTAGGIVCYGTLEGYFKCLDQKDGKELFKYKTASGIVGNVMTYAYKGKQYIAVYSGVGGWAGIGLAAGLTNPTDGLGMVGAMAGLRQHTALGGALKVFALP